MRFFIDTANIEETRQAWEWGIIAGVTTNPSLVAREGSDFHTVIKEIAGIVDGPISAEVLSLDAPRMVEEGRALASLSPNVVVKVPMTEEGLKAARTLSGRGIRTNVTLIFSVPQGLLAARAGATYVSPFVGRLDDINQDGLQVVRDLAEIFRVHGIGTQIIAASIRHPVHVIESARAGANLATVPFKVLQQMVKHPMTTQGVEKFLADWKKASS